jgi:hypothetical protein
LKKGNFSYVQQGRDWTTIDATRLPEGGACGVVGVGSTYTSKHDTLPMNEGTPLDDQIRIEIEAAAFRSLVEHLQRRTDVQNIDLMNLAGFCRNCLSKWYLAAAQVRGVELDYDAAREAVYGMPYGAWKLLYQNEASPEQQRSFEETKPLHAFVSGHHKG